LSEEIAKTTRKCRDVFLKEGKWSKKTFIPFKGSTSTSRRQSRVETLEKKKVSNSNTLPIC
jgi:hypothetical protein